MRVDPKDGRCRDCGGTLEILDFDDVSMNVECTECGDNYDVETDAFGDGCMTYYLPLQIKRAEEEGEFDDE